MIAIIDHYDSFTYNLVHYFERLGARVEVFQNDQTVLQDIETLSPELIVLSPGPGKPLPPGVGTKALEQLSGTVPLLGVCLGHQSIVEFYGGKVHKGAKPVHGKVSQVAHGGQGVFAGLASPTPVVRYHSLVADSATLPNVLEVTARAEDGSIMGVRHKELPVEGIQFHPESILTKDGFQMLATAYQNAQLWNREKKGGAHDGPLSAV
ncbi:aminodeoxychorismate/anthranilate synthase component II [Planococcus sp. CP5-4]|uniref:anthranilate synthase component II n=1 Tax=unclassified Planococcus (in: firmicutes) TaxID=2662419 RepID=UPI001C22DB03|nr:aminodeoxychorismate/anthranilate synthase component II [Planococcus sp. CP5-4]MBU9671884.1 aminodeoxychorismate/anthranilate synthase component II [Planococcus sp. CP5-4_YE]MBV0909204.1 aminodeoxychorismate/anthranilate synthase component II [Planococcus sp. CP5-4_UN]MBW6063696.1 aminodeoxychorismate/anthranilate synthase component II [Planococcus sp. CP5-4]